MKKYFLIPAILLALGATASAQQVDLNAERIAIENMIAAWAKASNQGGVAGADGYASFITEDAVFLPPNAVLVEGRAGLREFVLGLTMAEDFSVTWSATSINVAADGKQAYGIGKFEYSLKDDAGNAVTEIGKWVDIFEKQADGSWLCSVVMTNSDLPIGGASE